MPKSEKESFCGESGNERGSPDEAATSDVSSTNPLISASSSSAEREQKIDLLLYGRLLKQAAAKSAKPAAVGVVHSDPASAQLVKVERSFPSVEAVVPQSSIATSSAGDLRPAVTSVGSHSMICFQKPAGKSRQTDCGISAVHGPETKSSLQYSVPWINNAWQMTAPTSAGRRVAPTFCGRAGVTSSVADDPAVTAVVKVESPDRVLNQTYAVLDAGSESPEQLHDETFSLPSVKRECESICSVTAARPSVPESLVVNRHRRSIGTKVSLGETFLTASSTKPIISKKPACGAAVPASQHDAVLPAFNKLCLLTCSDPAKQVRSPRQRASPLLTQGVATKTSDVATTSTCPSDASDGYRRNLTKQTDCTSKQMACASSRRQRTTLNLQQEVASNRFLDRPVIDVASSVSANTHDLPGVENPSCLTMPFLNHTNVSASESAFCKVPCSSKAVSSAGQLQPGLCTFIIEEPAVSSAVIDSKPRSLDVTGLTKPATRGQQSETFTTCGGRRAPTTTGAFELPGRESRQMDFVDLCNDSNNNCTDCVCTSGMESVRSDCRVVEKSSRRRLWGFATSTPLRDCSPAAPDVSFSPVSSISVDSDWEGYDVSDESEGDLLLLDNTDEVMLLDVSFVCDEPLNVAFFSDDQPASLQSASCADTVSVTSHKTDSRATFSKKSSPLLSSPKSPESRPVSTSSCTRSGSSRVTSLRECAKTRCCEPSSEAVPVVRELYNKQMRSEVLSAACHSAVKVTPHKTESGGTLSHESCHLLSSRTTSKFRPVTADNRSRFHLRGVSNSRDRAKTKCCEPSSEEGPVASHLRSKRTRGRMLSSSSSDGEDASFTKQNSPSVRRTTRARLA